MNGYQENPETARPLTVRRGSGRTAVELVLRSQGRDLVLTVSGGESHVGAVAVARPALRSTEPGFLSLAEVPGHREGPLAAAGARLLAEASGRTVVVVVGIHQDRATRAEIEAIVIQVEDGYAELAAGLRAGRPDVPGKEAE